MDRASFLSDALADEAQQQQQAAAAASADPSSSAVDLALASECEKAFLDGSYEAAVEALWR